MIVVFIRNPVTLKHTASFPFPIGMTWGKLVSFKATDLEDSTEMSFGAFSDSFGNNITVFANLLMKPAALVYEFLPFFIHSSFGLRSPVNLSLVDYSGHKCHLIRGDRSQFVPI